MITNFNIFVHETPIIYRYFQMNFPDIFFAKIRFPDKNNLFARLKTPDNCKCMWWPSSELETVGCSSNDGDGGSSGVNLYKFFPFFNLKQSCQ